MAVINKNFAELDNENVKKLFYDSTGMPSIYIGVDNTGQSVIKVAKPGVDVTQATNDQLIFNSAQDIFKVKAVFTASFSVTSGASGQGSTTVTINHNLGYVPLTESTVNITSDWNGQPGIFPVPYFVPSTSAGAYNLASFVRVSSVTTTQIKYTIGVLSGSFTIAGTITCYVKQESAI